MLRGVLGKFRVMARRTGEIPAFAGMTGIEVIVIPAKAGISPVRLAITLNLPNTPRNINSQGTQHGFP